MKKAIAIGAMVAVAAAIGAAAASDGAVRENFTRRLTPDQYKGVIADTFGADIKIGGRADTIPRMDGLIEIGSGKVSVPPAGMEQYDTIARNVAAQVTDAAHRGVLIHCTPKDPHASDDVCARRFFTEVGAPLFRRPLTEEEVSLHVRAAALAAGQVKDFYQGLSMSLAVMLVEPQFLFREEIAKATPSNPGAFELDDFSKASRLSFFLTNAAPDDLLIAAARRGELGTPQGLARQVDRLATSSRLESGVRAFFSDMLRLDELGGVKKDAAIYPKFSSQVAADSREQTLKTIVDVLVTRHGDYRDIFTTKHTFLTRSLASIYGVPLEVDVPNGAPDDWRPYDFAPSDPRAGVLMQISFVAANAHPGRSSPTIRGKALREVVLCQHVPAPPGDVKFDIVQDTSNPIYKTARERLSAHITNPVCGGCHKVMDPVGLALENFDGGGDYRVRENGAVIDTSGQLDGVKFGSAAELGAAVHDNPATTSCLVDRMTAYAMGRAPADADRAWRTRLRTDFAASQYSVPKLMRDIAVSPELYTSGDALLASQGDRK